MFDLSGWLGNWDWFGVTSDPAPRSLQVVFGLLGAVGAVAIVGLWMMAAVEPWGWLVGCVLIGVLGNITLLGEKGNFTVVMSNTTALAGALCGAAYAIGAPAERELALLWSGCTPFVAAPLLGRMWTATFWSMSMVRSSRGLGASIREALAGDETTMLVRLGQQSSTGFEATRCLDDGDEPAALDAEALAAEKDTWKDPGAYFLIEEPTAVMSREPGAHYREARQILRVQGATRARFVGHDRDGLSPDFFAAEVRAGIVVLGGAQALVAAIALSVPSWLG